MNNEIGFDLPTASRDNLKQLSAEGSIISEQRICELSELADTLVLAVRELLGDAVGIYEILSLIGEELSGDMPSDHEGALAQNVHRLRVISELDRSFDRAVFAELLTKKLKSAGVLVTERAFLPAKRSSSEIFTYVKNAYSDEAFDVLSQDFSDPRLKYSASFKDAVRALSDGEASFALLPLEESGGSRLPTVTELTYKFDLKIGAVTPVFGPDGTSELKYALFSKSLIPPDFDENDDRYLEIRISADATDTLSGVMLAAKTYGIEIYRINTVSFFENEKSKTFFNVVFRGEGVDFTELFVYLTLFTEDFSPVGMYKNLE